MDLAYKKIRWVHFLVEVSSTLFLKNKNLVEEKEKIGYNKNEK